MRLEERIIYLREKNQLSQLDLTEKLNVSRQTVSRWETGESAPSADNLKELSKIFNVSVDYLLKGTEFVPAPKSGEGEDRTEKLLDREREVIAVLEKKLIREERIIAALLVALAVTLATSIIISAVKNQPEKPTPMEDLSIITNDTMPEITFTFDIIE